MARSAKDGTKNGKKGEQTEHPATAGHNGLSEDDKRTRFFNYCTNWEAARAAVKIIEEDAKSVLGKHVIRDFRTQIAQRTPEGEARIRERIETALRILRWNAKALGTQSNFLEDDDRTPAVDRAEEEGKRDGLAGDPCKTDYAPDTEQYRRYMTGYHAGQAVMVKAGIKPMPVKADDNVEDLRPRHMTQPDA
jgi:hypothetical protein